MLYSLAQKRMFRYRPVNDQIISARFQTMAHPVTIIQVYMATAEPEEDVINSCYTDLQNEVSRVQKHDILMIMGDFTARVGFGKNGL